MRKHDEKKLYEQIEQVETFNPDKINVMVDVFWPNPMAKETMVVEHKCHKPMMLEFPNLRSVSDTGLLIDYFDKMFVNKITGKSQVGKITVITNESLYPEKIILMLNSPLRTDPLVLDDVKDSKCDDCDGDTC